MRFGANYIPASRWLHFWIDFEEDAVRKDLLTLKGIGCDHIRAHLIWSYFQLNANYISAHCMNNLKKFVTICEEVGMDFFLSLFTGWMSGFHFVPSWFKGGRGNAAALTEDKEMIEAEKFYIKQISSVVAQSERFLGFDLGNELTCFFQNEKKGGNDKWAEEMFAVCEACATGRLHNNGVDHQPWFGETGFSRDNLANMGAITPMHSWIKFTQALERYGTLGTGSINLFGYMAEYAKAYAEHNDRQYWLQEFGISKDWEPKEDIRMEFMKRTFEAFRNTENLWGVTWWCSHDIKEELKGYDHLEYDLGLIDVDNKVKPEGELFRQLCEQYRNIQPSAPKRECAMVACEETSESAGWNTAVKYMEYVDRGIYPAIILAEQVQDEKYLQSRGITKILD